MKVLHRLYDLYSGGAEGVLLSFVDAFPEHLHVLLFTNYFDTWLSRELRTRSNVMFYHASASSVPGVIIAESPDLLIFHWYLPMGADDFGELNRDVLDKTVVYSHSSERVPLIPNVARYWFVSEFARQSSRELASASHTCIILNPVRERFFNQSLRSSREFRIGRHSRPSKTKFPTDLWTLFETIRVPGLTISILGAHEQLRSEFLSGRESLRHSYELLEFNTRDCAEYLTSLNVYLYKVSTEINEACPLSVLEAMACGLPVIAEDRAGLQEIIANRRTGFLCSESAEFAAVAEELWRDPFLRSSIGKAARKWAQENVTISAYRARVTKALEWMGAS